MGKDNSKFSYYNEFFKVYLSDLSSREMVIPPAFDVLLKINQETIPTNITLKDYCEMIWKVKVERKGKDLIIREGWKGFASYHSLKDGDFILFKYDGSSQFHVELYGVNGLKKGKFKDYSNVNDVDLKDETIKVNDVDLKDEPTTEEKPLGNLPIFVRGCNVKNTKTEPTNRRSRALCGRSGSKPSETRVRKPGECQGARVVSAVARKKASFVFKMTEFKRCVYVPSSVLKTHDIKVNKVMKLRDENGKFWPVHVRFQDNGRIFLTSGWMDFCRAKKLRVGDRCAFEFVISEDKDSNVIQVQVISPKQDARAQEHAPSGGSTSKQTEKKVRKIAVGCKSPYSVKKMNPTSIDTGGRGENTGLQLLKKEANVIQVEEEEDRLSALQRAIAFKSKNPLFWLTIQQSNIHPVAMLDLPQWFTQKYLRNSSSSIILGLPDGRYWRSEFFLEVFKGNSRASLINGWSAFAEATHLKVDDVCVFELIITDETMLKVHIFRNGDGGGRG